MSRAERWIVYPVLAGLVLVTLLSSRKVDRNLAAIDAHLSDLDDPVIAMCFERAREDSLYMHGGRKYNEWADYSCALDERRWDLRHRLEARDE